MKYRMRPYLSVAAIILMLVSSCAHKEAVKSDSPGETAAPVSEKTQPSVDHSVYKARDSVLGYFMPANGDIIAMEGGLVKVRPADDVHFKKGMRFSVFREGAPFYHPVTNELIGNAEDSVGRIEITGEDAVDGAYTGAVIRGDVRAGDKARISSSRMRLAFFQDRKADWSVSETFYDALKDSGRFEIVESYAPDHAAVTASRLARELGAEAALLFSTPVMNGKRSINIKLYWAEDAGLVGEIEEEGQVAAGTPAPDDEFISGIINEAKPWRTFSLPGGLLIAMGDVDGNGTDEFAVSDGRDIRIYSVKEDFRELWNIKGRGDGSHLSLDILDVNNNGRAEIFVTSAINAGKITTDDGDISKDEIQVNSFVLEYDPSAGYKRIDEDMPYFLRVLGKTLLMQRFSSGKIFSGPVYNGEWDGRHYGPAAVLGLPAAANIYGFAFVDWKNDGRSDVMTYDDKGYLCLYDDNGSMKWKSDKSYGPFTFSFESRTRSLVNPVMKWSVRGRLAVVKTGRGQDVVAVRREPVVSMLPGLGANKAEVYSLWWDGSVMDEKLIMDEIYGAVTDYWIQGRELFLVARAGLSTFLNRIREGEFSGNSILFYYNFAPSGAEK